MTKYRCLRCPGHSACLPSALPISLLLHASPGYSLGTQIPSMRGLLPLVEEAVESLLKADLVEKRLNLELRSSHLGDESPWIWPFLCQEAL